jgi:hypothetical protein
MRVFLPIADSLYGSNQLRGLSEKAYLLPQEFQPITANRRERATGFCLQDTSRHTKVLSEASSGGLEIAPGKEAYEDTSASKM